MRPPLLTFACFTLIRLADAAPMAPAPELETGLIRPGFRIANPEQAYPAAAPGQKRLVIPLAVQMDESAWKVEIKVGKTLEIDGAYTNGTATIEEKSLAGNGFKFYEVKAASVMLPTRTSGSADLPAVTRFVTMGSTGPIRYNSKFPLIVYVPEGLEVRYRLWKAEPEAHPATEG
jgi:ecotin